jgi:hypothetical protein
VVNRAKRGIPRRLASSSTPPPPTQLGDDLARALSSLPRWSVQFIPTHYKPTADPSADNEQQVSNIANERAGAHSSGIPALRRPAI